MSSPVFVPLNTGDTADDDGQVIDSFLIETDAPPTPVLEPIPFNQALIKPRMTTRMQAGSILLDASYTTPVRILPADPDRQSLTLLVTYTGAAGTLATADFVYLAYEGGLIGSSSSARIHAAISPTVITLDKHTGAIYVQPNGAITATIEVSWMAVTA